MAVPLQGGDQAGQDRLETLATDSVRGFPQDDQGFPHRLVVGPPSDHSGSGFGETVRASSRMACLRWHPATATNSSRILVLSSLAAR